MTWPEPWPARGRWRPVDYQTASRACWPGQAIRSRPTSCARTQVKRETSSARTAASRVLAASLSRRPPPRLPPRPSRRPAAVYHAPRPRCTRTLTSWPPGTTPRPAAWSTATSTTSSGPSRRSPQRSRTAASPQRCLPASTAPGSGFTNLRVKRGTGCGPPPARRTAMRTTPRRPLQRPPALLPGRKVSRTTTTTLRTAPKLARTAAGMTRAADRAGRLCAATATSGPTHTLSTRCPKRAACASETRGSAATTGACTTTASVTSPAATALRPQRRLPEPR